MASITSRPSNDPNWHQNEEEIRATLRRLLIDARAQPGEQHAITIPASLDESGKVVLGEIRVDPKP